MGISQFGFSQVGINTTSPNAQLDVKSSNQVTPANTDGILIPKIDAFPLTNPTAAQNSMMVYLTTVSAGKQPGFYYWDNITASWKGIADKTGWSLMGNAGTNPATNFIGTTDFVPLNFRINNENAGRIDLYNSVYLGYQVGSGAANLGLDNTGIGSRALFSNTTGDENTAVGSGALENNTGGGGNTAIGFGSIKGGSGYSNTANGYGTLGSNTGGNSNNAFGTNALGKNTSGNDNVAFGSAALYENKTGSKAIAIGSSAMQNANNTATDFDNHNIAIGFEALRGSTAPANNTGDSNTAIGYQTMLNNTSGNYNTALGASAFVNNLKGKNNIAIGANAAINNTNASQNIAIGSNALQTQNFANGGAEWATNNVAIGVEALYNNNPTAAVASIQNTAIGNYALRGNSLGDNNTATGFNALYTNTFGSSNVATGSHALYKNGIGVHNIANGNFALYSNTDGGGNTAIGSNSLLANTTGGGNVAIGTQAGDANTTGNNNISIGANSDVINPTGNNQMSIANVIYGANMDNLNTAPANISIGAAPSVKSRLYSYMNQLTANDDGQSSIYGFRTRDSQNNGTKYSQGESNSAVKGYNVWGDLYSFGVSGFSYNDELAGYSRSGGVLGAQWDGVYWGSLGYRSSGLTNYGVYASAANYATGTGKMARQSAESTIGGGFYGGIIGSWSKGNIGSISSGNLFASYNSGDEYTAGRQVEIVETPNGKKAAYTMTSTESVVYKKGKITLVNGSAHVAFDADYALLLGDVPIVTVSPMGQCNGIYIESVDKAGFTIRELNNGSGNVSVSWIAVGDRVDAGLPVSRDVLVQDFDSNINEVMFNENNKQGNAKAVWSNGNKINFGTPPKNLIQEPGKKEEK